jgi:thiamine-phosphate pyrophosphorylase
MRQKSKNTLYLVVDPMPGLQSTLPKIEAALDGGADVIQLWNNWNPNASHEKFITAVCDRARKYDVPVLINEHWEWLLALPVDGVHFDAIPNNFKHIKVMIKRRFSAGITCGNAIGTIHWAIENNLDYISFCSLFPSSTANRCEIVRPDIIRQARALTDMPIYVSGGITCDNISTLLPLGIDGVAVVSGVMNVEDPKLAARKFKHCLEGKDTL